jgi:hypothetical protein
VVDTSYTVGTFYETQLTKMGAYVDLVDNLQEALEILQVGFAGNNMQVVMWLRGETAHQLSVLTAPLPFYRRRPRTRRCTTC